MMYGYDFTSMMGWNGSYLRSGLWGVILYIVIIVDLVLLGIWLWKKISEKK